jgi:CBS domain-containing protein
MKASDLMVPVETLHPDDPATELIRHFAGGGLRLLAVVETKGEVEGKVVGVVTDEDVLSALLPSYVLADESLARVLEEGAGEELRKRLEGRRIRDVCDLSRRDRPVVVPDDTLIEVGAALARSNDPGVLVVDQGRLLGAITVDRLLAALLGPE